jgi:CHASE2 domain-containing sensor protein
MNRPPNPPEHRHFPEPEIIPPERPEPRTRRGATWTRLVIDEHGVPRVSVTRIGPLGVFVAWLIAGLVGLALVVFFFGAVLFLIPLIVVLLAVGVGVSIWRFVSQQRF